jgi:hypothetical protein
MRAINENSIDILRRVVKWSPLFDMIRDLGDQCNDRKFRFDKSDLLEMALEEHSDGQIEWVDDIGFDHIAPAADESLEMKTQKGCLYTPKTKQRKARTKAIKLTNTLGASEDATMSVTADWLLLVDTETYSVAVVPYAVAVEKAKRISDGWTVQLESEDLEYLFEPADYEPGPIQESNWRDEKLAAMRNLVRQYKT